MSTRPTWTANAGPQEHFVSTAVYECLYGGAGGGGKSEGLLMAALRFINEPTYRALIVRRTYAELSQLVDRASRWYLACGGVFNKSEHTWSFPSGSKIQFGYCENEDDVYRYQGAEYSFLGIDELTHLSEKQYLYLTSRLRSAAGLPIYIRMTCNPAGPDHWVFKRFRPWIDPRDSYTGVKAASETVLYYRNTDAGEIWVDKNWRGPNGEKPLSRMFIKALAKDNPRLMEADPGYVDRLGALDPVTRAQLRDGDWLAQPGKGLLFKRGWFEVVPAPPVGGFRIRYWDRAATKDGDWTVGLKLSKAGALYYVEDVIRFRGTPAEVEATIKQTAEADGHGCAIGIEQDPGQAGKFEASYYVRALAGFNVRCFPVTKKKVVRAQPVSAQAEAGNVKLVAGEWLGAFLAELEAFPEGKHDDQVDAFSGAFSAISSPRVSYPDDDWEGPKRTF